MRTTEKLEKRRLEVLSDIATERLHVDLMVARPRYKKDEKDDPLDEDQLQRILAELAAIEKKAREATNTDALDDLRDEAQLWGAHRAYLCPAGDIFRDGDLAIDLIAEWGVPKPAIRKLGKMLDEDVEVSPAQGRSALHKIFEEQDSWSDYTDDYEEIMRQYTVWLFTFAIGLPIASMLSFHFAHFFPPLTEFGLFCSGAAGSCVSVMRKMPELEVSLSREREAYLRRIWSRIGFGVAASMVGSALLGWGVLPISIQGQTFTDAINTCCGAPSPSVCAITKSLVLLGVAMLMGFSERALPWMEQTVFRHGPRSRARSTGADEE